MKKKRWFVYQDLNNDPIFQCYDRYEGEKDAKTKQRLLEEITRRLLSIKEGQGCYYGWKDYVVLKMTESENRFTRGIEKGESLPRSLWNLVLQDMKEWIRILGAAWPSDTHAGRWLQLVHQREATEPFLQKSALCLMKKLITYHKKNGTGVFLHQDVFKVDEEGSLIPLVHYEQVHFDQFVGYKSQIQTLQSNTEGFLQGKGFNNMLLYGDRGTGKSSSVKALLQTYRKEGLRVIELKKQQLIYYPTILQKVRDRRHKFLIFIDDLSFEPTETSYKDLKAALEGSFESKTDNVMMVVTSNRRHLIKESFADRESDIHVRETIGEQLSLFDRFGLIVYFDQPSETLYRDMVLEIARREGITLSEEQLLRLANEWKVGKGSKSGRSVKQFIETLKKTGPPNSCQ